MRECETTFIIQPEISDQGTQELLGRIDGLLERRAAIRLLHDDQGKRRLAYDIQKFQKGRYVTAYYLDVGQGRRRSRAPAAPSRSRCCASSPCSGPVR